MELAKLTLDQLGGGVIPALFEEEMERVLANIDDPSTAAKKPRKIMIELVFTPDENREAAAVTFGVRSVLASSKPCSTSIFIGRDRGRMVAFLRDPAQPELPGLRPIAPLEVNAEENGG